MGRNRRGGQANAGLVDAVQQMHQRGHPRPRHRPGPFRAVSHGSQQGPVPMVFQNAPNRSISCICCDTADSMPIPASVGADRRTRTRRFMNCVRELAISGPLVQVDHSRRTSDVRLGGWSPQLQTIRHEVAGVTGRAEDTFSWPLSTPKYPAGVSTASGCMSWSAACTAFCPGHAAPRKLADFSPCPWCRVRCGAFQALGSPPLDLA